MIDLFRHDDYRVTHSLRGGSHEYLFAGPAGPEARAVRRPAPTREVLRRLVSSRSRHQLAVFDLGTDAGSPRLVVTKAPGHHPGFDVTVEDVDGSLVGRAGAKGGFLKVFPDVALLDGHGALAGTLRGRSELRLHDAADVECGSISYAAPAELKVVNRDIVLRMQFAPAVPVATRALVAGALVGWQTAKSG